jgi:hypothetical protein
MGQDLQGVIQGGLIQLVLEHMTKVAPAALDFMRLCM